LPTPEYDTQRNNVTTSTSKIDVY